MAQQGLPDAPNALRNSGSASGYSAALGSKAGLWGGIEFGGNAHNTSVIGSEISEEDTLVGVDTDAGAQTITIPNASAVDGRVIWVYDERKNAGTNAVTLATANSDNIDESSTITAIDQNGGSRAVAYNGTAWHTISNNTAI